jgi:hypothetical protein
MRLVWYLHLRMGSLLQLPCCLMLTVTCLSFFFTGLGTRRAGEWGVDGMEWGHDGANKGMIDHDYNEVGWIEHLALIYLGSSGSDSGSGSVSLDCLCLLLQLVNYCYD